MKLFEGFWIEGWMPVQLVGLLLLIFLVFVITNTLLKRIGMGVSPFWQAALVWSAFYGIFKYVVFPPLPSSLFYTYMGLITLAVFVYIGSTDELWEGFKRPIVATLAAESPGRKRLRGTIFIIAPILTMAGTYSLVVPKLEEPIELRTVGPALPASVIVHGHTYRLDTPNPFRVNDRGDFSPNTQSAYINGDPWGQNPPLYLKYVREGGEIYFQNCHFCHGANAGGDGMVASAFDPFPTNFVSFFKIRRDADGYLFARVAKGGPGLPREGFPWASSMPPGEEHLTVDEMWKVVLFVYWHTGFSPLVYD